jgi:hypothetical protein
MSAIKNPNFNSLDVQQFLKLLGIPEVQIVFNLMVDAAIALSENRILKRLTALEVRTGLEDPIDKDHPMTLPEQLSILTDRIDNKTETTQESIPVIEPRTTLEHKATEFALYIRDAAAKTGKQFLGSKEIMHFLKHGLPEPLRMKDIQNPRQFKKDVLGKAKSMFPFIDLNKKKEGRRTVRVVYKPENDINRLNRTDPYIRSKPS